MPDDVTSPAQPVATPAPAPQGQPAPEQPKPFQIPEKFANKSPEEIARAYVELESKYGETSSKLKPLEEYTKIGSPQDIAQAIDYARNIKAAMDRGLLVPRGANGTAPVAAPQPDRAPWEADDFAYRSPQEQYQAIAQHVQSQNKQYIDQLYQQAQQQIQGYTTQDARQKSILMKAIKAAITNPGTDPEEVIGQAAELAGKTPEELIEMVIDQRSQTPAARQAEIERLVNERVAERERERQARELADISSASMPRRPQFGSGKAMTREQENRSIIEQLSKNGVRLI